MNVLRRLLTAMGGGARTGGADRILAHPPPRFVPAEFLGRPASACRFPERRAVIGYADAAGQPSLRMVTFDEVLDQSGHLYLSGYCHERFDRRHFRLDRITFLHRFETGEHVDPAREMARWLRAA